MQTVDEYFITATESQVTEYKRVKSIVKNIVPEIEETISYGIPTFKYKGKYVLYFGAFKDHVSLFPGSQLIEEIKDKLTNFKVSKGTIQYSEKEPVPETIIRQLVQSRMQTINSK